MASCVRITPASMTLAQIPAAPPPDVVVQSVWDFVEKGGIQLVRHYTAAISAAKQREEFSHCPVKVVKFKAHPGRCLA